MRIHHIALRTTDLPRLRAFYENLLGLRPIREQPKSVWLDAAGTVVMLEIADPTEARDHGMEMMAFGIEKHTRPEWRGRLAAAGVAIESESEFTLYFRDPEGRRVGLSHFEIAPA